MKIKIMSLLDIVGEKIFDSFQEYDAIVIRKCKQDNRIICFLLEKGIR